MFCPKCGQNVPDGAAFCGNCGTVIKAPSAAPQPQYQQPAQPQYQQPAQPQYQQPAAPVYQQPAQPVYQQPVQPAYQQPAAPAYQQPVQPAGAGDDYLLRYSSKVRARGIVALVFSTLIWIPIVILLIAYGSGNSGNYRAAAGLAIASVILFVIAMIMLIPGFIVSIVGFSSAMRFKSRYGSFNGNALTGMILSIVAFVLTLVPVIMLIVGITGGVGLFADIMNSF